MRNRYCSLAVLLSLVLLAFLPGCKKDFDFEKLKPFDWQPDFAVPLVNDSITFERALRETGYENNFYIDESGDISILYYFNEDAFHISVSDLLDLPPFIEYYSHNFSPEEQQVIAVQDFPIPPYTYTIDLSQGNTGVRIDKLLVKSGKLFVNITNTFSNAGYLEVKFLNATKNGQPFSAMISPFESGNSGKEISLDNVLFDLSANPNQAVVQVDGLIKQSNSPGAGDFTSAVLTVEIDTIGRFEGFLGDRTFPLPEESVRITVFNNAYNFGDIYFVDPKVSMTIYNSIGVPALVTVTKLEAANDNSGVKLDIASRLGPNANISIPSPSPTSTTPSMVNVVYTNANTGNSMDELFDLKPDRIVYQVDTRINPNITQQNFFTDTSSFYANLYVQLPLFGHFTNLTIQDTFDFDLNRQEDIAQASIHAILVNGLPLTSLVQVYFTDDNYNKIDSLMGEDQVMIREAPVDPATYLPYPGQYGKVDTSFFIDGDRMDRLSNARKMLVKGTLHSADNGIPNVKIRANQALKLKFSADVKLKMNVEP